MSLQGDPVVHELQQLLVRHGYMTDAQVQTGPGILGPKTRAAMTRFLADRGSSSSTTTNPDPPQREPPKQDNTSQLPVTAQGVPLYAQGDTRWGERSLGSSNDLSIRRAGCAMTATAMAISKISGQLIDPKELDEYLDRHNGYSGNALNWGVAAQARGLNATWPFPAWSLATLDKELEAGRPVVVGVDYRQGSGGGRWGTDHWVTITAKSSQGNVISYTAHDPANGKKFTFTAAGDRLKTTTAAGAGNNYVTTGEMRTFYKPATKTAANTTKVSSSKKTSTPGKPKLTFNGHWLCWAWSDGSKPAVCWAAVSGRSGYQSKEYQKTADKGPIPEGEWLVSQSKYQKMPDRDWIDQIINEFGRGAWPGGESSWGKHRIWLTPKQGTKTHGRSGFSIHGGDSPGSAGCIDLTDQLSAFIKVFREYGKDVDLTVKYE
jgi:hypothetical protein